MEAKQSNLLEWSIDVQVFLALFGGLALRFLDLPLLVTFVFGLFLIYALVDKFASPRIQSFVKFFILAVLVGFFTIGLTVGGIILRRQTTPSAYIHDGAIQIEESAKFILAGKNPYVENYLQTPLVNWEFKFGGVEQNPALYHNAYLPFMFLSQIPFYLLSERLIGWFDIRFVFLGMFLGLLFVLSRWVSKFNQRMALLLLVALNPFFVTFFAEGRNDVFVLFWIVLAIELMRQKRVAWSALVLGLACASKLTAWFLIPFWALYIFQPPTTRLVNWMYDNKLKIVRRLLPLGATITIIILPFILWNPGAFIDDVWFYPNGTSAIAPYPVYGYGFNILMQALGWLPSNALHSPFEILQWIIGLPLLFFLMWRQIRSNTVTQMWFSYALLLGGMGYFSHVLNDNHIGFILILFTIAMFCEEPAQSPRAIQCESQKLSVELS